jgi:hypothetical protein
VALQAAVEEPVLAERVRVVSPEFPVLARAPARQSPGSKP